MKISSLLLSILAVVFAAILQSCNMGNSHRMSQAKQKEVQSTFDTVQQSFDAMLQSYREDSANFPSHIKTLYRGMENMHQQMAQNHSHMMSNHQHSMGSGKQGERMMGPQMHMKIQDGITAEWYKQMRNMHQQMALAQKEMGHPGIGKQHQKQAKQFRDLMDMVPKSDAYEEFTNPEGDPALLNGASLFVQNCSSCHGKDGQGLGNSFPPLINAEWITGKKSIPVRIIRDGLTGPVEVKGITYHGNMPSFKARLSVAEIASIVNYLRKESEGEFPALTQDDVISISKSYTNRSEPWTADELLGE